MYVCLLPNVLELLLIDVMIGRVTVDILPDLGQTGGSRRHGSGSSAL